METYYPIHCTSWMDECEFITLAQNRPIADKVLVQDPCGAMYDPHRDIYHLFYQWHPHHINWGKVCSWPSTGYC